MRRVSLRWKISSLKGSDDISRILEIVDSIEVLGHLAVREDGVVQLAEIIVPVSYTHLTLPTNREV